MTEKASLIVNVDNNNTQAPNQKGTALIFREFTNSRIYLVVPETGKRVKLPEAFEQFKDHADLGCLESFRQELKVDGATVTKCDSYLKAINKFPSFLKELGFTKSQAQLVVEKFRSPTEFNEKFIQNYFSDLETNAVGKGINNDLSKIQTVLFFDNGKLHIHIGSINGLHVKDSFKLKGGNTPQETEADERQATTHYDKNLDVCTTCTKDEENALLENHYETVIKRQLQELDFVKELSEDSEIKSLLKEIKSAVQSDLNAIKTSSELEDKQKQALAQVLYEILRDVHLMVNPVIKFGDELSHNDFLIRFKKLMKDIDQAQLTNVGRKLTDFSGDATHMVLQRNALNRQLKELDLNLNNPTTGTIQASLQHFTQSIRNDVERVKASKELSNHQKQIIYKLHYETAHDINSMLNPKIEDQDKIDSKQCLSRMKKRFDYPGIKGKRWVSGSVMAAGLSAVGVCIALSVVTGGVSLAIGGVLAASVATALLGSYLLYKNEKAVVTQFFKSGSKLANKTRAQELSQKLADAQDDVNTFTAALLQT